MSGLSSSKGGNYSCNDSEVNREHLDHFKTEWKLNQDKMKWSNDDYFNDMVYSGGTFEFFDALEEFEKFNSDQEEEVNHDRVNHDIPDIAHLESSMFAASIEKLELMKIAIENDEFSACINDLDQEEKIEEDICLTVSEVDTDVECYNDVVESNVTTAAKVRASRRKKRRVKAQQLKQQAIEERMKQVRNRNLEKVESLKRNRIDDDLENRRKSNFSGLGYQATEARIEASKEIKNDRISMSGAELRRLKSNARAIPVEDMYLAFSVQDSKMNDVLSFSDGESEEVFAIIDTGTSVSISDVRGSLLNMRKDKNVNIMGFNGSKTRSRKSGTAVGTAVDDNGEVFQIKIDDVHDVSGAPMDLISVSALVKRGYQFHFTPKASYLTTPDLRVVTLIKKKGLYFMKWKRTVDPVAEQQRMKRMSEELKHAAAVLNDEEQLLHEEDDEDGDEDTFIPFTEEEETEDCDDVIDMNEDSNFESYDGSFSSITVSRKLKWVDIDLLHRRLGHFHPETITAMSNNDAFSDVKVSKKKSYVHVCETCRSVKATRNHIPSQREGEPVRVINKPFQRVWSDVKGELPKDLWGNRYMVSFTCEVTRWSHIYFMKHKSEVKEKLKLFLSWVKKRGWKVEILNSDGGGEYQGDEIAELCDEEEIEQQFTAPYTPQHNGISENMNRILTEHASCLLNDASLNKKFWSLAMRHVCWIRNRMFASALKSADGKQRSPYQALFGKNPSISMLKVFGCDTWRLNHLHRSSSFEPRALKGIHVGISATHKAWMVYDLKSKKIRISYHCSFNESFENRKCSLTQYELRRNKAGPAASSRELAELELDREVFKCEGDDDLTYSDKRSEGVEERTEPTTTTTTPHQNVSKTTGLGADSVENDSVENDNVPIITEKVGESMDIDESSSTKSSPKSGREVDSFDDDDDDKEIEEINPNQSILRSKRKIIPSSSNDKEDKEENMAIPERKAPIGKAQELSVNELKFLKYAFENNQPIIVQSKNPKLKNSKSRLRYEQYKDATTLREFQSFGGKWDDILFDYARGYLQFVNKVDEVDKEEREKDSYYANKIKPRNNNNIINDKSKARTIEESAQHELALIALDHIEGLTHRRQRLLQRALGSQSLEDFAHCCASRVQIEEPLSVAEALASDYAEQWRAAMDEEIDNLIKFQCFDVVDRADAVKHGKLVKSKWVFKVKYNADGSLQRFRARLVAKGFSQSADVDYYETFSPVFGYTSLRTVLARAAAYDLQIDQWDLKNSFIQQDIDVPHMYMECPEGYSNIISGTNRKAALHFKKSLYGLKQSSRLLHKRLASFLKNLGFKQLVSDQCVFTRGVGEDEVTICTWVDDIIMCSKRENSEARKKFDFDLRKEFEVSPWTSGEAGWILNMNVKRDWSRGTLHLSQEAAIEKLAKRFDLVKENCEKPTTPMDSNLKLVKTPPEQVILSEEFDYMSAVGGLLYISMTTRPDISYATSVLSRFMACPGVDHVRAAKRVIQYLYRTKTHGLLFSRQKLMNSVGAPHASDTPELYVHTRKNTSIVMNEDEYEQEQLLRCYCDADLAGDVETRRSTSGFCIMLFGAVIHWVTKLQPTVALSTAEAETIAATEAIKQIMYLRLFLRELGHEQKYPTAVFEDNAAAIAFSEKREQSKRTKHYQMKVQFLSEQQELGIYKMIKVGTKDQLADTFTKALPVTTFNQFRNWMGVVALDSDNEIKK